MARRSSIGAGVSTNLNALIEAGFSLDRVVEPLADLRRLIATDDLVAAIDVYKGDVLPEDTYDDWATSVRDDTRVRFANAAHRLAEQATRSGDHGYVCALAGRILATDPYDESAHRRLLSALSKLSRFGDARRAYQVYVDKMADIDVAAQPIEHMTAPLPDDGIRQANERVLQHACPVDTQQAVVARPRPPMTRSDRWLSP